MSETSTRDKVIFEAMKLFASGTYGSVSMRDIANAAGIRESSLYYHFRNKQDIFDSVLECGEKRCTQMFENLSNSASNTGSPVSAERLIMLAITVMNFFMADEQSKLFRRMLIIGQYSDERLKHCFRSIYINQPLGFFTQIFSANGTGAVSPDELSREFYSPLYLLICSSDSIAETLPEIKKHILTFVDLYMKGK